MNVSKDAVNHPAHYTHAGEAFEPIKVIEAWGLGFCLGNTVKYIARAGHKDPGKHVEDLEKARWYLDREIARLKADRTGAQIIDRMNEQARLAAAERGAK